MGKLIEHRTCQESVDKAEKIGKKVPNLLKISYLQLSQFLAQKLIKIDVNWMILVN